MPTDFYSHNLWRLISLPLEPWAGGLVWKQSLAPEIFLLNFVCHMWCGNSPFCSFAPPISLEVLYYNSVVVGPLFSSVADGCKWSLFYSLVVILMWLCKEASCVFLQSHLDLNWLLVLTQSLSAVWLWGTHKISLGLFGYYVNWWMDLDFL